MFKLQNLDLIKHEKNIVDFEGLVNDLKLHIMFNVINEIEPSIFEDIDKDNTIRDKKENKDLVCFRLVEYFENKDYAQFKTFEHDEAIKNKYLVCPKLIKYIENNILPPNNISSTYNNKINKILSNYFINYKIPQNKEIDLLRFTNNSVIAIEVKQYNTKSEEKLKLQLEKTYNSIKFLKNENLNIYIFGYVYDNSSPSNTSIYQLITETLESKKVDLDTLYKQLEKEVDTNISLQNIFSPNKFLIRPFQDFSNFQNKQYLLTDTQNQIKIDIINYIKTKKNQYLITVKGSAGSGKSLLAIDIAKELSEQQYNIKFAVCHRNWKDLSYSSENNKNLSINSLKKTLNSTLHGTDLLIIDEAQRISHYQLNKIVRLLNNNDIKHIILFYDDKQTIDNYTTLGDVKNKIENLKWLNELNDKIILNHKKLTNTIRTTPQISSFINKLFDLNQLYFPVLNSNESIEVHHFDSNEDKFEKFISKLKNANWVYIDYTSNDVYGDFSIFSHSGLEYTNLAVKIDDNFIYKENELTHKSMHSEKMKSILYTSLTRTSKNLKILVIDNKELYSKINKILNINSFHSYQILLNHFYECIFILYDNKVTTIDSTINMKLSNKLNKIENILNKLIKDLKNLIN